MQLPSQELQPNMCYNNNSNKKDRWDSGKPRRQQVLFVTSRNAFCAMLLKDTRTDRQTDRQTDRRTHKVIAINPWRGLMILITHSTHRVNVFGIWKHIYDQTSMHRVYKGGKIPEFSAESLCLHQRIWQLVAVATP